MKPTLRERLRSHRFGWVDLALVLLFSAFLFYQLGYRQGRVTHTELGISTAAVIPSPSASEEPIEEPAAPPEPTEAQSPAEPVSPIDLNTADMDTLQQLPGIGPQRAKAIIAYREENGPFLTPEDLMQVEGISEGIYNGLKDQVTVSYRLP